MLKAQGAPGRHLGIQDGRQYTSGRHLIQDGDRKCTGGHLGFQDGGQGRLRLEHSFSKAHYWYSTCKIYDFLTCLRIKRKPLPAPMTFVLTLNSTYISGYQSFTCSPLLPTAARNVILLDKCSADFRGLDNIFCTAVVTNLIKYLMKY